MATKILIPGPLRQYIGMREAVEVNGGTVGELLDKLADEYSPLRKHLFTADGSLRSFVNVYINDEDIRYLQKEATRVTDKDVVSIVPSIAGGV
jgi:molybdopterin converting factor small subunit